MRLPCELHIDFKKKSRTLRKLGAATITLRSSIKEPRVYNLTISTKQQLNCATYKNLKANVLRLFTSCVKDGKMTISLREPQHDLFIRSANVPQLEKLLSVLKAIGKGEEVSMRCLKEPKMEALQQTALTISNRSSYPLKGFPDTLKKLHITNIRLSRIQKNILELSNLVDLSLDDNALKSIPPEMACMRLRHLSLAQNQLTSIGDIFLGPLGQTIKFLDVSDNQIARLSFSIARPKFRVLDLSHNRLSELPPFFRGGDELQLLRIEGNNLTYFPSCFMARNAKVILERPMAVSYEPHFKYPPGGLSLLELSCIRLHQSHPNLMESPLEQVLPRHVHAYLLAFVPCRICGRPTFPALNRRGVSSTLYLEMMRTVEYRFGSVYDDGMRLDYLCTKECSEVYRQRHRLP